jgi:hypothetical protein
MPIVEHAVQRAQLVLKSISLWLQSLWQLVTSIEGFIDKTTGTNEINNTCLH